MGINTFTSPSHSVNDYRSWSLQDCDSLPFDMLWINQAGADPRPHRVLPSGEPSISVRRIWGNDNRVSVCELVVCCQYTIGSWHRPPPGEELIALRLKPEIAAHTLGIDPVDYMDDYPLAVPTPVTNKLQNTWRLAAEGAPANQVASSLMLELRLQSGEAPSNSSFVQAASILRINNGLLPIRTLARNLDVSARTLQRHFVDHLGVSPKFYARRLRLTQAAILADRNEEVVWADVAAACGYHDQAHLINDYQDLIGLTPAASHRERLGLSDFSNS